MRLRPAVFLPLFLSCAILAGCGKFFTKDSGSCTSNCTAATNAYLANSGGNSIGIYTLKSDGSLTLNTTAATAAGPSALLVWSGKVLFVPNQGANNVSGFAFGANGSLSNVSGSPFATGASPIDLAMDPTGRFLYVANAGDGTITSYTINSSTGSLTVLGTAFAVGAPPIAVTMHPSGKYLFAALGTSGIAVVPINTDGTLATGHIVPPLAGGSPQALVSPGSGTFVYAADGIAGVEIFSFDSTTGNLTAAASTASAPNPAPAGSKPVALVANSGGNFLYVANQTSNNITGFAISGSVLTQISGSPYAISSGASQPSFVAMDPTGAFVYSVNQAGPPGISIFSQAAGKLTLAGSAPGGTQPVALAFH